METAANETTTLQAEQTLQLKRTLVPIDEYAEREGVSIGIVEQCARLGIIQIRKFKGETFVVDLPLNLSVYPLDANADLTQPADKSAHAQKLSELVKRITPEEFEDFPKTTKPKLNSVSKKAAEITNLAKNIFRKSPQTEFPHIEIIDEQTGPDEPIEFTVQSENPAGQNSLTEKTHQSTQIELAEPPESIDRPTTRTTQTDSIENAFDSILDELKSQPTDVPVDFSDEILETEEMNEQQAPENSNLLLSFMDSQAKSKRTWQTVALSAITAFLILLLLTLWLHADRKTQLNMLDQANANIQTVLAGSSKVTNKIKTLQNELDMYKAEIKRLRTELSSSRAQLKTAQSELADAGKSLKIIRQRDTAIIERLDAQIKNLSTRLNLLTQNP
jgi:outer membrane murein-binding lipoprotein Lpp